MQCISMKSLKLLLQNRRIFSDLIDENFDWIFYYESSLCYFTSQTSIEKCVENISEYRLSSFSFDSLVNLIMDFHLKCSDIAEYYSDIITTSYWKNFSIILPKLHLMYNKSPKKSVQALRFSQHRLVKFSVNIVHIFSENNFFELPEMSVVFQSR